MRKVYGTSDSEDEVDEIIDEEDRGKKSDFISNLPEVPLLYFFIQKHCNCVNCKDSKYYKKTGLIQLTSEFE